MNRLFVILLMMVAVASSGCVATRKFTRNEVKASSDALDAKLNAKIDANAEKTAGEIKETRDAVDQVNQRVSTVDQKVTTVDGRVTTVDGKVTSLDTRTTQGLNSLKSDVTAVDAKTAKAMSEIGSLDEKFQSRNNLSVAAEHSVPFKFDSATLDKDSIARLDEIAATVMQDNNAIIVLEGHTDSTGDRTYNVQLGERRVDAVRRYLATEKSVPVFRIHQISFGAARPVAENKTREGREKNRSVTIMIMTPATAGRNAALQQSAPTAP